MATAYGDNRPILDRYLAATAGSAALAASANSVFPSGVTHDSRFLEPHGIYVTHADGALKWDVDGNEYVDYFGGHGALLLGHNHPVVSEAVRDAYARGTHFGAGTEAEIAWGNLVIELVPCAERVRFTSSGTEATTMALRLARAKTGRRKLLRFKGHFHGWTDEVTTGYKSHYDGSPPSGITRGVSESAALAEPGDVDGLARLLSADRDIAAVILEPLGGGTGTVPVRKHFLEALRSLTREHGVVLIFDEVVTGFRVSPGGVQAATGVTPDLTTLAKILAGGLPGGAVTGRAEFFDALDYRMSAERGIEKIYHPGTFNANPVSAVAGRAALEVIATTDACEHAARQAARLREELNGVLEELGVPWAVYGESSAFHIFTNPNGDDISPRTFDPYAYTREGLSNLAPALSNRLRLAMLINGVDLSPWPGGLTSVAHDDAIVDRTVEAFRSSLRALRAEALIA